MTDATDSTPQPAFRAEVKPNFFHPSKRSDDSKGAFDLDLPIALTLYAPKGSNVWIMAREAEPDNWISEASVNYDDAGNESIKLCFASERSMRDCLVRLKEKGPDLLHPIGTTMLEMQARRICTMKDSLIAMTQERGRGQSA